MVKNPKLEEAVLDMMVKKLIDLEKDLSYICKGDIGTIKTFIGKFGTVIQDEEHVFRLHFGGSFKNGGFIGAGYDWSDRENFGYTVFRQVYNNVIKSLREKSEDVSQLGNLIYDEIKNDEVGLFLTELK